MHKIAVLVDSSSYLTSTDLTNFGIFQINNPIVMGQQVFHENEDWATPADFYTFQAQATEPLTTSQPEVGVWLSKFEELAQAGYTDVIVVVLSSGISGTFSTVQALAQGETALRVHPWDSKITVLGEGNQAKLAARLVQAGQNVPTILTALTQLRATTQVRFAVDDIKHLQRTGRISGGQATLGSLLNIKPLLTFDDAGKIIAIGKERAMKRAWKKIQADFATAYAASDRPLRATIVDGGQQQLADEWARELQALYPDVVVERGIIGPYIGVHTGEKAMGLIWAADFEKL